MDDPYGHIAYLLLKNVKVKKCMILELFWAEFREMDYFWINNVETPRGDMIVCACA